MPIMGRAAAGGAAGGRGFSRRSTGGSDVISVEWYTLRRKVPVNFLLAVHLRSRSRRLCSACS